jgi:hypothetical protein
MKPGVGVEKVQFLPKQPKFVGYEMSRKIKMPFVGDPSAILFLRISREGVFQHPQAIALKTCRRSMSDIDSTTTSAPTPE